MYREVDYYMAEDAKNSAENNETLPDTEITKKQIRSLHKHDYFAFDEIDQVSSPVPQSDITCSLTNPVTKLYKPETHFYKSSCYIIRVLACS